MWTVWLKHGKQPIFLEDSRKKAIAYHDTVHTYFDVIRYHVDKLELIVDNQMWTLPKYRNCFIS